jgi:hypothetical protein
MDSPASSVSSFLFSSLSALLHLLWVPPAAARAHGLGLPCFFFSAAGLGGGALTQRSSGLIGRYAAAAAQPEFQRLESLDLIAQPRGGLKFQIGRGVPKAEAYSVTMYLMAGLLLIGFAANVALRPARN